MQTTTAYVLVGFFVGALATWVLMRSRFAADHAVTEERLVVRDRELELDRETLTARDAELTRERADSSILRQQVAALSAQIEAARVAAQQRAADESALKNAFSALAADALDANSQRLVALAKGELGQQQIQAASKLAEKESAITALLQPVQASLEKLEAGTTALELKRESAYASMLTEIGNIRQTHELLRGETNQLVSALRDSGTRGIWGALQLQRCIEFAGMHRYCSFDLEKFVRLDSGGSQRPDCVLYLPNKRTVIVDAKTPMEAFLQAVKASDGEERKRLLMKHAAQVRAHLDLLETKAYWKQFSDSPDFVICFLPKEALFSAALEADPSLIEYGSGNVILATPTTLIALLKAVAYGWHQLDIARDAEKIRDAALKVHAKLALMHESILDLGAKLRGAGRAYDEMLTRAEGQGGLFSIARKLRELKIGERDLPESKPASVEPRPLSSEDWQGQLSLVASAETQDPAESGEEVNADSVPESVGS